MNAFSTTNVNFFVALMAGFLTFFASCLLPLVPTYIAYLSGLTLNTDDFKKRRLLTNSVLFVLGFILVFMLLGTVASGIGIYFNTYKLLFQRIGGIFLILMGLFMLNAFKPTNLMKELKIDVSKIQTKWEKLNSFIFGLTFGFAWTPCIGPVLGTILFWASQSGNTLKGTTLLFAFGLGLAIPFLIISLFFEKLAPKLKSAGKFTHYINLIAAILIIITGLLMALNQIDYITTSAVEVLGLTPESI